LYTKKKKKKNIKEEEEEEDPNSPFNKNYVVQIILKEKKKIQNLSLIKIMLYKLY